MRKTDSVGLERPILNGNDVIRTNISFPDSIRLEPIRLPRATILRNSPIFDISSRQTDNPSYPRGRVRPPLPASYGPYVFPENMRTRRYGDDDMPEIYTPPNGYPTSSMSAVHAARLATDRVPSPEQQRQEMRNAYFSPENHVTPTIPRISPTSLQGEYPQQTADNAVEIIPSSSVVSEKQTMCARALEANTFLGYQRFTFIITKYPALVLAMVALWNVTGRGKEMPKSGTEEGAFYAALVTAGIVLISQILLCGNHHYSYKKARIMVIKLGRPKEDGYFCRQLLFCGWTFWSYLYHFAMLAAFCAAAACVALAAVNINRFRDITEKATTCKYQNNAPCYSNHERLIYISTLIGCGGMVVILALTTFLYGAVGQGQMKKRLAEEYKKEAHQRTYENQAFQY